MPSEQFERKLRARLEHAQVQPRPELWETIAQQVAEQSGDKRGGLWIWLDGILGLLLVAFFLIPLSQPLPYHKVPQEVVSHIASAQLSPIVQGEEQEMRRESETQSESIVSEAAKELVAAKMEGSSPSDSPSQGIQPEASLEINPSSTSAYSLSSFDDTPSPSSPRRIVQQEFYTSTHFPDLSPIGSEAMTILNRIDMLTHSAQRPIDIAQTTPDVIPLTINGSSFQPSWVLSIAAQSIYSPTFGLNPFAPTMQADLRSNFPRGLGGDQQIEDIYAVTFPRSGFVARIGLAYQFSSRLSIESGIGFSRLNHGQYRLGSLGEEAPIGPTTPDPFIIYEEEAYHFQQSQIELPLHLNVALTQGLNRWIVSGGITMNHQLAWKVQKGSSENLLNEERSILSTNQSLVLGQKAWYPILQSKLLYQRKISSGMAVSLGPVVRYQLQGSYTGSQSIGQSKLNAGIELGIQLGKRN